MGNKRFLKNRLFEYTELVNLASVGVVAPYPNYSDLMELMGGSSEGLTPCELVAAASAIFFHTIPDSPYLFTVHPKGAAAQFKEKATFLCSCCGEVAVTLTHEPSPNNVILHR